MKTINYNNPPVGCYVDESSGSADDCNERTIEFAQDYGFPVQLFSGCFDGLRGTSINMSLEEAMSASHSGRCDEDVDALVNDPAIASQLDAIGADVIRAGIKETGGWDTDELADDTANRARTVWIAACDIRENKSETLSDMADEAIDFLNEQETRTAIFWQHEDNSLFLVADADSARENVDFVSSSTQDYPDDDFRGEWLHISDHGNATLYCRGEDGNDAEIWSLV